MWVAERMQRNGETAETSEKPSPPVTNVYLIKHFPQVINCCWGFSNLVGTFRELENIQYKSLSHSLLLAHMHSRLVFVQNLPPSPCPPPWGFAIKQQGNLPWWPDVLWYFSTDNIKWEVKCCNTCSCWLCTHSAQAQSTLFKPDQHQAPPPIKKLNHLA